jgi:hypothetical protein
VLVAELRRQLDIQKRIALGAPAERQLEDTPLLNICSIGYSCHWHYSLCVN